MHNFMQEINKYHASPFILSDFLLKKLHFVNTAKSSLLFDYMLQQYSVGIFDTIIINGADVGKRGIR